jgi:hypothetical protein
MAWVAVAVGGGAIAGGLISANAAKSAANTQAKAAGKASDTQLAMFNTLNDQQTPYRQSGYSALNAINAGLGIDSPKSGLNLTLDDFKKMQQSSAIAPILGVSGGDQWAQNAYSLYKQGGYGESDSIALQNIDNSVAKAGGQSGVTSGITPAMQDASNSQGFGQFTHSFNASDLNANLAPNYQFMLDQGIGQTKNMANSTGGLIGGNALQGINTFAQNYAKNAYQDAFQNYNANQTNIFNRLSSIAGLGQTANQATANAAIPLTGAATNYMTSGAAAQAAGTVGSANAISGGINGLSSGVLLRNLLGGGGGGLSDSLATNMSNAGAYGLGAP